MSDPYPLVQARAARIIAENPHEDHYHVSLFTKWMLEGLAECGSDE